MVTDVLALVFYVISLFFLVLSFIALILEDWRRDKDVKETMLIRLAFSVTFVLLCIFLKLNS